MASLKDDSVWSKLVDQGRTTHGKATSRNGPDMVKTLCTVLINRRAGTLAALIGIRLVAQPTDRRT